MPLTGRVNDPRYIVPFPHTRVVTSVPFTYRDGLTMLELLYQLRTNLDSLQSEWSEWLDDNESWKDDLETAWAQFQTQNTKAFQALRTELIKLIHEANDTGLMRSVVYGSEDSHERITGDIYDNTRYFALFSGDYDDMELTAQEYDALELSARVYDLRSTAVVNAVPGDFPGRSRFPFDSSMPPAPTKDVYVTKADAAKTYMQLHPTATSFEEQ